MVRLTGDSKNDVDALLGVSTAGRIDRLVKALFVYPELDPFVHALEVERILGDSPDHLLIKILVAENKLYELATNPTVDEYVNRKIGDEKRRLRLPPKQIAEAQEKFSTQKAQADFLDIDVKTYRQILEEQNRE